MAYNDFQEHLNQLESLGKLHTIEKAVDPTWEVSAITRHVFDRYSWANRPALRFNRVGDSKFPLVVGAIGGSPAIYGQALCTTEDKITSVWEHAQRGPVDPVLVKSGICKEVISRSDDVDIGILPHSVWTPGEDPGPFITAGLFGSKDPENGSRNLGTYRLQVKGPRRLGVYIGSAQHGARHVRKYEALRKDMPVAITLGADPAVVLASVTKVPYGMDEYRVAGGIRGEAVPLVKCETVDLEVPANAEIVLEGIIKPGILEEEGPFGEFSGYMSTGGLSVVIELTCMTRRHHPVYHAFLSQMPPSESSCIRSLSRSAALFHHLRHVLGLPVTDVYFTESGGSGTMIIIAMRKEYPEQVKEVAWGTWSLMNKEGKFTIVVDDDIDVRNSFQVEWAMAFRVQPARDIFMVDGVVPTGVDPSTAPADVPQHDRRRKVGSKILIDATRKHKYPPAAGVPKKYIDAVMQQWTEYGFRS
jgi:UbiD family decarboxylase